MPRRWEILLLSAVLLPFVIAPTPGDVGGCGEEAQLLDAPAFFRSKTDTDCDRCKDCGFVSSYCSKACDPATVLPNSFNEGCFPLVHDGEVCLRALQYASCSTFADYARDDPSTRSAPSECNFCPVK